MEDVIGRLPTVPEYYQKYIDAKVSLLDEPKQCCPFHSEKTPSFSYNIETGRWRCFGACHTGGDVIDMHRLNFHLSSRDEAKKSLMSMYDVSSVKSLEELNDWKRSWVDEDKVNDEVAYQRALSLANTPERWIELDYVMSMTPVEHWRLVELINKWNEV